MNNMYWDSCSIYVNLFLNIICVNVSRPFTEHHGSFWDNIDMVSFLETLNQERMALHEL